MAREPRSPARAHLANIRRPGFRPSVLARRRRRPLASPRILEPDGKGVPLRRHPCLRQAAEATAEAGIGPSYVRAWGSLSRRPLRGGAPDIRVWDPAFA